LGSPAKVLLSIVREGKGWATVKELKTPDTPGRKSDAFIVAVRVGNATGAKESTGC
jgi:hypothetical protein